MRAMAAEAEAAREARAKVEMMMIITLDSAQWSRCQLEVA